ncbi:MAG: AHH domain-containing protein [Pseudomonadota bacterium]
MSFSFKELAFDTHHLIAQNLVGLSENAQLMLEDIGFKLNGENNLINLAKNSNLADTIRRSSDQTLDVFKSANIGTKAHDGSHPNYDKWIAQKINTLVEKAKNPNEASRVGFTPPSTGDHGCTQS